MNILLHFMANITSFCLLLVFSAIYFAEAQNASYNIRQGSSLTPTGNSSWLSPSGLFAFGFFEQAHSGLYGVGVFLPRLSQKLIVWTANRDDPPVSNNVTLVLTIGGRLILQQNSQGSSTYIVKIDQFISSAAMLDNGNFVLYDSNQQKIWQSFDHPTDTILPGQILSANQTLISSMSEFNYSTGIFELAMQDDSNLVLYTEITTFHYAYWASYTWGKGYVNVTLNLDPDGHLYLLNNSAVILQNLTAGFPGKQKIYIMRMDVDGIPRIYSCSLDQKEKNSSLVWAISNDKCFAPGLCGINSYCAIYDDESNCVCLPGFEFVNPGNRRAGCQRRYSVDSCKDNNGGIQYNMTALENSSWYNDPYSVLKIGTREECEAACLEDCNCEAAFSNDGECRKQKLPLKYGKRSTTDFNIALIKWASQPPPEEVQTPPAPTLLKKEKPSRRILIISILLVALAFMVFAISGLLTYRKRIRVYKMISAKRNVELMEDIAPRLFTYAELEKVTNGFQEAIGRGASGTVYKGTLEFDNKVVAVKRLENMLARGEEEFQNEIKVIGRTHHRNLVRLLGYSLDGPSRLLVYEYMINGSLADMLFEPQVLPSWEERIRIALEVARGILYLHEECETQIIHCDIKPQNILIDEYRSAKISDFGLAKLLKPNQTNTTTVVRGTRGYVAPEWHRNMPVTVKADIYSFGIMLLEIICCRKCVDLSLPEEETVLEYWVYQCFESQELDKLIVDEKTEMKNFERMVRVGLWCILDEPSLRPSMKKVLLMLEGTVDIPVPPSPTSYLSAI